MKREKKNESVIPIDNSSEVEEVTLKKIGEKIRKLRKEAGYKNYENFAFDNDLNRVQYGKMESGINFTIKSLLKILRVHGMKLNEFFRDIDV